MASPKPSASAVPGSPIATQSSPKSPKSPEIVAPAMFPEHVDAFDSNEADSGGNSDYETSSSLSSATTSLSSSVRDYIYENGRRYHRYGGEGKYGLPNDEAEQDRLDLVHHVLLLVNGGELHRAPVHNPHNVLDCGTGTGIWALDFGDTHPEAKVIGVDLSPIQPGWTAPNVKFEVDDLEKAWTWPENHFDFVHIRSILNGIRDYQRLVDQAFKHTKPGGYTELTELSFEARCRDGTLTPETSMYQYFDALHKGYTKMGIVFPDIEVMKKCMEKAGFVDINCKTIEIPWGPWPKNRKLKELGATIAMTGETGFEAYGIAAMTRALGMDIVEAKKLCHGTYKDVIGGKVHAVGPVFYVYGRKPAV